MDKIVTILKSISEKNRLRIINALLIHTELCACQITEFLGVAGATASRHLGLMVNAGVLKNRKQGRWVYFRVNRENQELSGLLSWVENRIGRSGQANADLHKLKQILLIPCEELSQKQRENGACITLKKRKIDND